MVPKKGTKWSLGPYGRKTRRFHHKLFKEILLLHLALSGTRIQFSLQLEAPTTPLSNLYEYVLLCYIGSIESLGAPFEVDVLSQICETVFLLLRLPMYKSVLQ